MGENSKVFEGFEKDSAAVTAIAAVTAKAAGALVAADAADVMLM
jgi:hypothetical protein